MRMIQEASTSSWLIIATTPTLGGPREQSASRRGRCARDGEDGR
jgi:hypothetical protein